MQDFFNSLDAPDPVLGSLDRRVLLELHKALFPDCTDEEVTQATRRELIDLIRNSRREPGRVSGYEGQGYPLRRRHPQVINPGLFAGSNDHAVYWCRQQNPLASAAALARGDEDFEWSLRHPLKPGDLIVTALESSPPLIVSLEVIDQDENEEITYRNLAIFSDPISVIDAQHLIGAQLPRRSQYLKQPLAEKLLESMGALIADPRPIFITAGPCDALQSAQANEVLSVLATLQKGSPWEQLECRICDREILDEPEAHLPHVDQHGLRWEIQEHVDEAVLMCSDCHDMAHQPTLQQLRNYARPACPKCGERNPRQIIWGMPAFIPDPDDFVVAGCVLPMGPMAQWECRACSSRYLVADAGELAYPELMVHHE